MAKTNTLWVEKHRPQTLDEFVGNQQLKDKVALYLQTNDIPHLLFYGKAGTGKTTLAKLIRNHIKCDDLYINASDENSVDTVRQKIKSFASSMGFADIKIIILDECLDEETLITVLRNGTEVQIPIKNVDEINDLVKSYNIKKEKWQWRPFYLLDKGMTEVYEIEFRNNESVVCTADHKWYVENDNGDIKIVKTTQLEKYNHILSP